MEKSAVNKEEQKRKEQKEELKNQRLRILGRQVAKARDEKGWLAKDLADKLDIEAAKISNLENGDRNVSVNFIFDLADVFNCRVDFLLGFSDVFDRWTYADVMRECIRYLTPLEQEECKMLVESFKGNKDILKRKNGAVADRPPK